MKKENTLLFLGTGASAGIPMIGCSCARCLSTNPKNKRLRPSVLISVHDKKILIDTSPDFRIQALQHSIAHLDGVLLTHTHYDHIAGIDELRVFYLKTKKTLPVLLSNATYQTLKERYSYLFKDRNRETSLPAQLDFHLLEGNEGERDFLGVNIKYLTYYQGGMDVTGFRFGTLAYVSDISKYDEGIFKSLEGVKILIMSALKQEPSYMHLSIDQACAFAKRVGADQTYLMHLSHDVDHDEVRAELPAGIDLAYDGLTLNFEM